MRAAQGRPYLTYCVLSIMGCLKVGAKGLTIALHVCETGYYMLESKIKEKFRLCGVCVCVCVHCHTLI